MPGRDPAQNHEAEKKLPEICEKLKAVCTHAPPRTAHPYCFDYVQGRGGAVNFTCSQDADRFAWLELSPHHPAVIQTQNFWASIGAIIALEGLEASQWTALTWTDWQCGAPGTGHAVRGTYHAIENSEKASYRVVLFDAEARAIVTMHGRGVVFRKRDFPAWREGSKSAARTAPSGPVFTYAAREQLGLSPHEFPFVGQHDAARGYVPALVTAQNGLPPANPLLSGSGDHVNTTHFAEAARQAVCLITDQPGVQITGGEMRLNRYVELGAPFVLVIVEQTSNSLAFSLEQLDKACAQITLRW